MEQFTVTLHKKDIYITKNCIIFKIQITEFDFCNISSCLNRKLCAMLYMDLLSLK